MNYLKVLMIACVTAALAGAARGERLAWCVVEDGAGGCERCDDGFYPAGGGCAAQDVPDCVEFEPNTNRCRVFRAAAVAERRLQATCLHTSKGSCVRCPSRYYVNPAPTGFDDQCLPLSQPAQCVWSDGVYNACGSCGVGFIRRDSGCVADVFPFCGVVSATAAPQCASCLGTMALSPTTGFCANANSADCIQMNAARTACVRCASLFFPSGGACAPVAKSANCATSNGWDNACDRCVIGYSVNMGVCNPVIESNCVDFDSVYNR